MDPKGASSQLDPVTICVKLLSDLEQEIRAATSTIERNRLMELEESLWRQETLCARVKRAIPAIRPAALGPESSGLLREAASRLRVQSQIYENLIGQSRRSMAILQHLCSLYRNAAQHPGRAICRSISREA